MPFKTWAVGEEVLAADFNSYVQRQTVATFANAAARTAAITAPSEGMLTYLADFDSLELWNGTAWRAIRYGSSVAQTTVAVTLVKNVIPGSGSQLVFNLGGWASAPVVVGQVQTEFRTWLSSINAVTATQINFWVFQGTTGAGLPDNTPVQMFIIAVGTPAVGQIPTIS